MSTRYDVIYPRPYKRADGQEGTDWLRVGVAFLGTGNQTLILYTVPTGAEPQPGGGVRLILKESDGRERGRQQGGPQVQQRRPQRPPQEDQGWPQDPSDDTPF